jgi:hypothetical protein
MNTGPCIALDILHRASRHVREQWDVRFDRPSAKANLDARAILFNCSNQILRENGMGISREEVEGAAIIERESCI